MWEDPIVAEVRRHRQELAAEFGYDLKRLCEHLRQREREHPELMVSYETPPAPRPAVPEQS